MVGSTIRKCGADLTAIKFYLSEGSEKPRFPFWRNPSLGRWVFRFNAANEARAVPQFYVVMFGQLLSLLDCIVIVVCNDDDGVIDDLIAPDPIDPIFGHGANCGLAGTEESTVKTRARHLTAAVSRRASTLRRVNQARIS
jgi:hypothetical protein